MKLIMMCGQGSSGKSYFASQLKSKLKGNICLVKMDDVVIETGEYNLIEYVNRIQNGLDGNFDYVIMDLAHDSVLVRTGILDMLNFEDKEIMLPSEVTKMSIRRVVNIPDNLMEWLSPWKNFAGSNSLVLKNGPSTQWCFLRRVRLTGIQPIHDGLRHSCASYLLVQSNDADYTAEQLGHCVPVLNKNYKGLVRKVASDKFYNIRPDANEQPEIRFKEI